MVTSSPQKILYVITKSNFGGAQRYVYDLASSVSAEGYEVTVAFGGTGEPGSPPGLLKERLEESHISTFFLKHAARDIFLIEEFRLFLELFRLFRNERPDVVHLNSSKIGGLGALAARFARIKKIIFTAHGFAIYEEHRSMFSQLLIRIASWFTVLFSTHTIVITSAEYTEARAWPLVGKKIRLIYNGIGALHFLQRTEARKRLAHYIGKSTSIFQKKTVIGYIGELTPNRDISLLIEAISHDSNMLALIIGDGEERARLEEEAQKREVADRVIFFGFIPDAYLFAKAFDVFVFPSQKEGLSYTLLEIGLAEVPIIATRIGGNPDIITHQETGILIAPRASDQLAQALTHDKKDLREYAKRLAKQIKSDFSLENTIEKTIRVYEP